ncbi:hypothetical protein [Actinacidiphila paucisporea]|uniref:Exo-beta-D-glucosaminidase Ig-fold domain-containing protein n=1 Tax=Actinacidiphila paucisporea TaxID=310782 RepID=A0A1M7GS64_9ACTN|nr:hypothetical protein [Actinacidiphila paucisporea]SHM19214.1 hypothetical protein SAMN05216499_10959 [Actinacidiphila paucisporea]
MPKNPTSLSRPGAAAARIVPHGGETVVGHGAPGGPRGEGYLRAVADRLGTSTSAQELSRKAQFVDYESMRAMFEAWNARMRRGAATPPFALPHPARHTPVWPVCGHGLDVSGGFYGARKGCEPLHVQADRVDGTVLTANHTATALRGAKVAAQLYDLGGRPIGAPSARTADLAAGSVSAAFAVPFSRALPATHLLRLRLTDADGRLLSANDYWRYRTPTDMRALNGLPHVRLSVAVRPAGQAAALIATVANTGAAPAATVRVSLADPAPPALADDNCLWLLPGESREVTLRWRTGAGAEPAPTVVARAYNALPATS